GMLAELVGPWRTRPPRRHHEQGNRKRGDLASRVGTIQVTTAEAAPSRCDQHREILLGAPPPSLAYRRSEVRNAVSRRYVAYETRSSRHTAAVSSPSANSGSAINQLAHNLLGAVTLLRRHDLAEPSCAHVLGRKTLISRGSTDRVRPK